MLKFSLRDQKKVPMDRKKFPKLKHKSLSAVKISRENGKRNNGFYIPSTGFSNILLSLPSRRNRQERGSVDTPLC